MGRKGARGRRAARQCRDHARAIIGFCNDRIADYKPRSVEIRVEPLPLSGAGKILRMSSALRTGSADAWRELIGFRAQKHDQQAWMGR